MAAKEMFSRFVQIGQDGVDTYTARYVDTYIKPTDMFGWQLYLVEWSLNCVTVESWPVLGGCSVSIGFYQELLDKNVKTIFDNSIALRDSGFVPCSGRWVAPPTFYINCERLLIDLDTSSTLQVNDLSVMIWYKKIPLTETQKFALSLQG